MNKDMIRIEELELRQRELSAWGKVAPQLFTFEKRTGKGMVRHG